ncbi:MAG: hypothetical protein DRH12_11500 [Deltaproteobacteria bacterium]|nr:MAG: hypothetical protein DRH12_11500 [Deltaproteobacteria bacterium]RLB74488.1 MAG: hypothetical protein DRH15_15380 [Deltaproteobacteria bacterium]
MQIYWRIMNELLELGEILIIHDPSVLREYGRWCRKNCISSTGTYELSPHLCNELLVQIKQRS